MGAVYEIDECGVQAVARCDRHKAFCHAHRDRPSGAYSGFICIECQRSDEEYRRSEHARISAAKKKIQEIAAAMVNTDVEPEDRFFRATEFKRRLPFGLWKETEVPARHRHGWFIGEYRWSREMSRGDSVWSGLEIRATYLTPDGDIVPEGTGWIDDYSRRKLEKSIQTEASDVEFWENLLKKVVSLAQKRGVRIS